MSELPATYTRQAPELTIEIIKKYICPKATDQECYTFLKLCESQGLNPFLREAYLIKYGTEDATIVVGKDTFTKRADRQPNYDGFKAGIILLSNNQVIYREGSFFVSGETLLGGWAEVYRKDRSIPFRNEVRFEEYVGKKSNGEINSTWTKKPATMIRKVPLVQSLREAFPDAFGGLYSPEEMSNIDASALPVYEIGQAPHIPPPETGRPPLKDPVKKSGMPPPDTKQEIKDPDAPASEKQVGAIHGILKSCGITDDLEKHDAVSKFLEKPETITSFTTLTKGEASKVIEYFQGQAKKRSDHQKEMITDDRPDSCES